MNPSKEIIKQWLGLVKDFVKEENRISKDAGRKLSVKKKSDSSQSSPSFSDVVVNGETKGSPLTKDSSSAHFDKDIPGRIGIHCLAGLGRYLLLLNV